MKRKLIFAVCMFVIFSMLFSSVILADTSENTIQENTDTGDSSGVISSDTDTDTDTDTDADTDTDTDTGTSTGDGGQTDVGGDTSDESTQSSIALYDMDSKKTYSFTKSGEKWYAEINLISNSLCRLSLKEDGVSVDSYLIYKKTAGKIKVTYFADKDIDFELDSGDVCEPFDFSKNNVAVTVIGGCFDNLPGKFKNTALSMFYFAEGDEVAFTALPDDDKKFVEWSVRPETAELEDIYSISTSFVVPSDEPNILVKAKFENKLLSLEELILNMKMVTLEENYILTKRIKLTSGNYVLDLGPYTITSSLDAIFELDGATLTIEGEGTLKSNLDYAIIVKRGTLTIESGSFIGKLGAIRADGGDIVINGGSFKSSEYNDNNASDKTTAIGILNNSVKLTVRGGAFYGGKAINDYGGNGKVEIHAGSFGCNVTGYVAKTSSIKQSNGKYVVSVNDPTFRVTVIGGRGSGNYKAGDTVIITADTDYEDLVFDEWSIISGDITFSDVKERSVSFIMPSSDVAIKASFILIDKDTSGDDQTDSGSVSESDTVIDSETQGSSDTDNDTADKNGIGIIVTDNSGNSQKEENGAMAIIVLIFVLVILLICSIVISIILIVHKYRIEKKAAELALLGAAVVESLADELSDIHLGEIEGKGEENVDTERNVKN